MKAHSINNVKWFLDDGGLTEALKGIAVNEETKRGYFSLVHDGRKFFVKFFKEKGLTGSIRHRVWPRGKKEYWSGKRLLQLSILTPVPVGYGLSDNGSYVVQEWIEGDTFVDLFLSCNARQELLIKLAGLLSTLKMHKVLHNDLHLNNIIVCQGRLYLVDLHKMAVKERFDVSDEVSNLSHAITMIYDDMSDAEKELFFSHYGSEDMQPPVEKEMYRLWERWIRKKKARAFDDTSYLIARGDYVYMAGREALADAGTVQPIKKDKKVTVERHSDYIRKIYRSKRRLKRAWENHVTLKYLNMPITPEPYRVKQPSLFSPGYIDMEDLGARGEELDRHLDRTYDRMATMEKRSFIEGLSRFFAALLQKKVAHRDLKACNIFVLKKEGFLLLDVEDIVFARINNETLKRMLIQMNTTVPKRINVKDRMRFYLKVIKGLKVDRKGLFRQVRQESLKSEIVYEGVDGLKREAW